MLPIRALMALCALLSVHATASPLPNGQHSERGVAHAERSPMNNLIGQQSPGMLHRSASPVDEEGDSTGNAAWISRPGGRPYKREDEGEDTGSKEFWGGGMGRPYKRQEEAEDTGSEEFFNGGTGRPYKREEEGEDTGSKEFFSGGGGRPH